MKKNLFKIVTLVGLSIPSVINAVTYENPTTKNGRPGFLVDLREIFRNPNGNSFGALLVYLINIGLGLAGLVSILLIIWGGYQYMISRGDEEVASAGKKTLFNAIIGLTVIILSYIMVNVINRAIGNSN